MATSNVNIVNTLGAGSGIDSKALAQSLVEAERAPRQGVIDSKIQKEEARITGHGAIKSLLAQLQTAMGKINDASEFTSIVPTSSQPAAFGATSSASAVSGTYSIEVGQVAKATRLASTAFASATTTLNSGAPFDLWFTKPVGAVTEQQTVTLGALSAGQSVTLAGLTLNASGNMTADEVAAAFSTPNTASGPNYALQGSLSGWTAGAVANASVTFTSTTAAMNVPDMAIATGNDGSVASPSAPTLSSVDGSGTQKVTVNTATPAGIVQAVNAATSTTGISAQLVNTGAGQVITFAGQQGAAHAFTISNLPTGMSMRGSALENAQDAEVSVNGLLITSATNKISDVITGVTLDLYAPTTVGTPARLDLNRQSTAIKDNIKAVVEAYNEFDESLKVLGDQDSKVEEFGGALAGDSLLTLVRNQIRGMFTKDAKAYPDDDNTQSPLNPNVYAARHIGISFDRTGKLTLDEAKLDSAMSANFDQVVTLLTANKTSQSIYSPAPGGLAGDAFKNIDKMLRSTGLIDAQTKSASAKIAQYKKELTQLEERMSALLERYTAQFTVMDSIVGESNSTRSNLTNSFKGLMAMYTNN
jgi:flagellar hook-associated protein 2